MGYLFKNKLPENHTHILLNYKETSCFYGNIFMLVDMSVFQTSTAKNSNSSKSVGNSVFSRCKLDSGVRRNDNKHQLLTIKRHSSENRNLQKFVLIQVVYF